MTYEQQIQSELKTWQRQMLRRPSFFNKTSKRLQTKMNRLIPNKAHEVITIAIKKMVQAVLFGARHTTPQPLQNTSLAVRESLVTDKINVYRKTAAVEGGLTGAGGLLWGLADFPLLLGVKLKLLFEIAALYGYSTTDYKERLYILYIFQLAFSSHEHRRNVYLKMQGWHEQNLPPHPDDFDWRTFQQEYRDYIDIAKMAQLIPLIGAPVGFVVNNRLVKKLGLTARNAYRMRWFDDAQRTHYA